MDSEDYVRSQQVEGEVIEFVIPNYQIHGGACNNECHGSYLADIGRLLDQKFGIDDSISIKVKQINTNISPRKRRC